MFQCPPLVKFSEQIPVTICSAYSRIGLRDNEFISYVVCSACHSVYQYEDCFVTIAGRKVSKDCWHVAYPNHPQITRRKKCGAKLLKTVKSGKGYHLAPIKVYPYFPLKNSLQRVLSRKGVISACESWRRRALSVPGTHLGDVYDGRVWQDFNSPSGHNFLTSPLSYLLTLNVDWFQPFSHLEYSVGAIYITIQNLPRSERFKEQNVLMVGVLPGPSEPNLSMNSYLAPLVEELKEGWLTGFKVKTPENIPVTVRVALTCVACDIPACRKVTGFLGHHASLACSKCLKAFPVSFGKPINYSGFNRDNWIMRTSALHRQHCVEICDATTKTGTKKLESKYGLRYSILLALPYFDPVRFSVIDPMHNLYLGTGKHAFKTWLSTGILSEESLQEIARRAQHIQVPSGVGRLPANISSNYGGFKADQWRTWITIYSPVVLKGILPNIHMRCWMLFVRACSLLSQRVIKKSDLASADLLLLNYCKRFQDLYGEEHCTMNLHLHLHLQEVFLDFGPSHAFWCYPFERYNGILGSFPTNNKAIEAQLMRKFITSQSVQAIAHIADPQLISSLSLPSFDSPTFSISSVVSGNVDAEEVLHMSSLPITSFKSIPGIATLVRLICESVLSSDAVSRLHLLYSQLYPNCQIQRVSPFIEKCGRINLAGDLIGSVLSGASAKSSSVIMSYWPGNGSDLSSIDYSRMRVGVVQFFLRSSVVVLNEQSTDELVLKQVFAYTLWKQRHPQEDWFGISATVCVNMFESVSMCSYVPVERIASKCAHSVLEVDFGHIKHSVFVACPLPIKYCL